MYPQERQFRLSISSYIQRFVDDKVCLLSISLKSINSEPKDFLHVEKNIVQQFDQGNISKPSFISKSQQCKVVYQTGTAQINPVYASQGCKNINNGVHVNYKGIKNQTNGQQIQSLRPHQCLYKALRRVNSSQVICSMCKKFTLQPCTSACDQFCFWQKSQRFSQFHLDEMSEEGQLIMTPQNESQKKQESNIEQQQKSSDKQAEKDKKEQKVACCSCNNGCLKKYGCGCVLKGIRCDDKCTCYRSICQNKQSVQKSQLQAIIDQILQLPDTQQDKIQSETSSLSSHMSFIPTKFK